MNNFKLLFAHSILQHLRESISSVSRVLSMASFFLVGICQDQCSKNQQAFLLDSSPLPKQMRKRKNSGASHATSKNSSSQTRSEMWEQNHVNVTMVSLISTHLRQCKNNQQATINKANEHSFCDNCCSFLGSFTRSNSRDRRGYSSFDKGNTFFFSNLFPGIRSF